MKHTKSRILAIFLCLCMVVTLVPTVAFAEEGDVFRVGDSTYKTLSDAANDQSISSGLSVIGEYEIQSTDGEALKKINKIVVEKGGRLKASLNSAAALLGATADVEIKAGGALSLPGSSYVNEDWFGGEDARMNIQEGSITLSGLNNNAERKWTLSEDAVVTVPEDKIAYLQLVGTDSQTYGVELSIPQNAALTVNGMLRGISGQNHPSKLTVNGSLDCSDGVLSLSAKPEVNVGETGSLSIGEKGIVTSTTGDTQYATANKIKVAPGGTITISENSQWKTNAGTCISGTDSNTAKSYTNADGDTVYGAADNSVSDPEAAIGGSFYTSLDGTDGALNKAQSGDTITLVKNEVTIEDATVNTIGEGVTLSVPKGKTLTVKKAAAGIMQSKGAIQIENGGTVKLPQAPSGDTEDTWIGSTDDARLKLEDGATATFVFDGDGSTTAGTLTLEGNASVPTSKTLYSHLNSLPLAAEIKNGTLTVNGTLNAVTGTGDEGSELTVGEGGVVKVESAGKLVVGKKASLTVKNGGTLTLPAMTKENLSGLKGDIVVESGATVSYSTANILAKSDGLINLASGTATLSYSSDSNAVNLTMDTGSAEISKSVKALLVTSDGSDNLVPFHITLASGATVTITNDGGLSIPNKGSFEVNGGTLTVQGKLELHSEASFSGKATVAGTGVVATYWSESEKANGAEFYLSASGAKVLAESDISAKVTSAASKQDAADKTYTPISAGSSSLTYGWEYYKPASTGGGGGSGSSATVNSVKATNGSFAISDKNAKAGDTVKITPKANDGYVVDQVTVTDKNGNNITVTQNADGTYSFVMPEKAAQPVDVKVTFKLDDGEKDCPSEKFTDVDQDKWYHEGVDYAIKNGLMNGTGADTFAPDATTTRAMVVTILYRLDGEPAVTKDIPFADVPAGQWYSNAINWAAANGIVNGYGDDKFGPDDTITREQMAAILYRYASYKGYSVSDLANLTGYTDAASVSEWASTAMRWAVAEGLIEGTNATTLSPSGDSTRAQVATILMRFCEGVVK